jgi:hypothetical protein
MRLQSKKSNRSFPPPIIVGVFLLSLIYWCYLALTTQMDIVFDSVGYQSLGRMIYTQGWVSYFTTGPNREPVYPLLVAASMAFEHISGLAYVRIMAIFGMMIMFLTQVLTYKILRLLNIRHGICAFILAYLALSPALNNSAFSLYSEIAALPFILGIVLTSFYAWEAIKQNKTPKAFVYGALLGLLLMAATFIKAVFECVTPVYLIIFFMVVWGTNKKILPFILCVAATASFYYAPITGYKWLNFHYNGNFVVTNRGSWALYGNTARRMEPLTPQRFAEALAFAPGEGVCNSLFGSQECDFWSFRKSDEFGLAKQEELQHQHLSTDKINAILLKSSAQKALHNPLQYTLLTGIEGLKMFFWESTQIGFVSYPHWLEKIYNTKLFNNGLRFLVSLISLIAVISIWLQALTPQRSPIGFLIGLLIFLYILFFSFFFILTRYALPIAPLYLIAIGMWINQNLAPKK